MGNSISEKIRKHSTAIRKAKDELYLAIEAVDAAKEKLYDAMEYAVADHMKLNELY